MELDTKSFDVSDVKCPTTTTGILAWKRSGGLPVFATCTTWGPWQMLKSEPVAVARMVPGTTVPSRRNVAVPSDWRCASAWSTVSK